MRGLNTNMVLRKAKSCTALCASAAAFICLSYPTLAAAQDTSDDPRPASTPDSEASAAEAEESIVITASKLGNDVTLERAPVSAGVVTGREMEVHRIESIKAVVARVPNFTFGDSSGYSQAYIRGVGTQTVLGGLESSVATYVDGVYLQRQSGGNLDLLDLAAIQVLRGPQAVLYGRNATAGAILLLTNSPTRRLEGYMAAEYGRFDRVAGRAVLNVPLGDTTAVRFAGEASHSTSYITNLLDQVGTNNSGRGPWNFATARGSFAWDPTDDLSVIFRAEYGYHRFERGQTQLARGKLCLTCFQFGATPADGFYEVNENFVPVINNEYFALTGQIVYERPDFTFTSITGWRHQDGASQGDQDVTDVPRQNTGTRQRGPTFTTDNYVRTTWESPFNFLVGWFYERERDQVDVFLAGGQFGALAPVTAVSDVSLDAFSIYGEAYWEIMDNLLLTVGARYNSDRKAYSTVLGANARAVFGQANAAFSDRETFNDFTPRAILSYDAGDSGYYYVSASRGAKSGGWGQPAFAPIPTLRSEILTMYEAGARNRFFNGLVRTQLSVFFGTWEDVQVSFTDPLRGTVSTQNAAEAEIKGLEFDIQANPMEGLNLAVGGGFLDNEFSDFPNAAIFVPNPNPLAGGFSNGRTDLTGTDVPRAPGFSGYAALDYHHRFPGDWRGNFSIIARYTDGYLFQAGAGGPAQFSRQSSYTKVDATAGVTLPGGRYEIGLFVDNLTNAQYFNSIATNSFGATAEAAPPRTYGIRVRANFGGRYDNSD